MKKIITVILASLSIFARAQQTQPQLLKEPANWQFERFALPPAFAPDFPYKGAEELRFSPGMFKKDSSEYFTYAFVAQLDNTAYISQNSIADYLLRYFKGLCATTAKERKLTVDTSKISVRIEKKKDAAHENIYNVWLNVFGVFDDGAPVKLNMEVKVLTDAKASSAYLFFIASPHPKTDAIWKKLYEIRKNFTIPIQQN
jgi:hypothetical protein